MPRKQGTFTKTFTFEGKRYSVSGKTEKEATVNMALKKQALESGSVVISSSMTVAEWGYICLETYRKNKVKELTYNKYVSRFRACIASKPIGQMPLQKVKGIHCQNCINEQTGNSDYQINQTKQLLYFIFKKAVKDNLIIRNPADDLDSPQGTLTERRPLTPYEEKIFLKVSKDPRFMVFRLMFFCGCRPSEAREAEGHDIMIVNGIPILYIRGTKNKKAVRYVPIPEDFYQEIKDSEPFHPIAANSVGKKLTPKAFVLTWKALKREMNLAMGCRVYRNELLPPYPLAEDLVPYCLRHSFCTNLLGKKIDSRITQYVMGHKNSSTTDIYTHINADMVTKFFIPDSDSTKRDDSRDDTCIDFY